MGEDEIWTNIVNNIQEKLLQDSKYRILPARAKKRALDKVIHNYKKKLPLEK